MAAHTWRICDCGEGTCWYCGGGLAWCATCGGAEGSLPTDCPGEEMSEATEDRVYAGAIDYRDGRGWVEPDGAGSSMGDQRITIARTDARKEETTR